jgi:hypothetical protein
LLRRLLLPLDLLRLLTLLLTLPLRLIGLLSALRLLLLLGRLLGLLSALRLPLLGLLGTLLRRSAPVLPSGRPVALLPSLPIALIISLSVALCVNRDHGSHEQDDGGGTRYFYEFHDDGFLSQG